MYSYNVRGGELYSVLLISEIHKAKIIGFNYAPIITVNDFKSVLEKQILMILTIS
jgi:hypothetical protein